MDSSSNLSRTSAGTLMVSFTLDGFAMAPIIQESWKPLDTRKKSVYRAGFLWQHPCGKVNRLDLSPSLIQASQEKSNKNELPQHYHRGLHTVRSASPSG